MSCRNIFRVFFHQICANSRHAAFDELIPVDVIHVEVEKLLVSVVKLCPQILMKKMSREYSMISRSTNPNYLDVVVTEDPFAACKI